ncbi:MAG: hypothetical protein AAF555_01115 [Verrucomicrobiota bacterium]
MNVRLFLLLPLAFSTWVSPLSAQIDADQSVLDRLLEQPRMNRHLIDATSTLSQKQAEELADLFASHYRDQGMDLLLITMEMLPYDWQDKTFELADEWKLSQSQLFAIIVISTGDYEQMQFQVGGTGTQHLEITNLNDAVYRAAIPTRHLPRSDQRAVAVSENLIREYTDIIAQITTREEQAALSVQVEAKELPQQDSALNLELIQWAAAPVLLLLVGSAFWRASRRKASGKHFPVPRFAPRLNAPWSGGSHAAIRFSPRR